MPSYNKVMLMGHLTRTPELRYTASGSAVADFGMAVAELPEHVSPQKSGITDDQLRSARAQAAAYLTRVRERSELATHG